MKKYILIFTITVFLLTMTSCVLITPSNLTLPKTIDEVEQMISVVPNCYYELEDVNNTEYEDEIPEGAQMTLIAEASNDFFVGVRFVDEDSLNNAYEKIVLLIEDLIVYEFNKDKNLFKIYSNDCWIYAGSNDFISYFEGKNDYLINKEEILMPLETIEERLKSNNFEVELINISEESKEYQEYGVRLVVLANNPESNDVIALYQMDSIENSTKYREQLTELLKETYYTELLDKLNLEIYHTKSGKYENYVYIGTPNAVAIIKGELLKIGN